VCGTDGKTYISEGFLTCSQWTGNPDDNTEKVTVAYKGACKVSGGGGTRWCACNGRNAPLLLLLLLLLFLTTIRIIGCPALGCI
jgi:hypothetical protein